MAVPAAAMGPSALGQSGPGSMAPWCSVTSGPTRYVLGMQELFRGHSKTREFPAHSAKVHSVAWSCDGRRLASGSFDKTASVFLLEKDRLVSCQGPAQQERGAVVKGGVVLRERMGVKRGVEARGVGMLGVCSARERSVGVMRLVVRDQEGVWWRGGRRW